MKRYSTLMICLAFLFASCNKEDAGMRSFTGEDFSFSDKAIIFADDFVVTKAYAENTAEQVREGGFNAACLAGDATVFNEKVEYDGLSSAYRTKSKAYYYPSSGKVDFFCVFPSSNTIGKNGGEVTLSYAQNSGTDLLVARRTGIGASDTAVVISFDHALSLIHFKAEGSDDALTYKVKSVSINVPDGGVFSYNDYEWSPSTDSTAEIYSSRVVTLDGLTEIPGAVVFVPCEPEISVQWDIYYGDIPIESRDETRFLGSALKMGEECTVTLMLPGTDSEKMDFDIVVAPWDSTERDLTFKSK